MEELYFIKINVFLMIKDIFNFLLLFIFDLLKNDFVNIYFDIF